MGLFVGLATGRGASAGSIIGQLVDPEQPECEGFVDILSARIEQDGGQLTFVIEAREEIPTSVGSNEHITFLWLVDADNDPMTGQPHEQLGSERRPGRVPRAMHTAIGGNRRSTRQRKNRHGNRLGLTRGRLMGDPFSPDRARRTWRLWTTNGEGRSMTCPTRLGR